MSDRTEQLEVRGERVEVDTPLGAFPAMADGDVVRIRNVRYARAARFAPPEPVDPDPAESAGLQQVRIACPQPASPSAAFVGSPMRGCVPDEDCLRLTITRPRELSDAPAPVLVWMHGGSYVSGAGDMAGHDAAALAREQGVLVVTVTSRLGLLGFLGDGVDRPANLGLLDLRESLRWVRAHIAAFGGDPDRVTVVGQSSGADAVVHLLAADGAAGLVRRAIVESAPFGIRGGRERMHERMLAAAGPLDATTPVDDVLAAQARAKEASAGDGLRSSMAFAPQYGHAPLPAEHAMDDRWRERAPGVDVLVTWTRDEASYFVEIDPKLGAIAGVPLVGRMLRRGLVRVLTRIAYTRDGRRFARMLARAGARVQVAVLTLRPDGSPVGAAHAIEVPLLFPADAWAGAPLLRPAGGRSLVDGGAPLRAAWAEFARHGRIGAARIAAGPGWSGDVRVGTP
ncbi:carboxylesterase family protein [Agromyces sp. SYSU T00194]|uniref:carboxylesterase family protein n=1 Tax=Agromyces chitinivorans TaxID=3158560 RepID=UPI00339388A2